MSESVNATNAAERWQQPAIDKPAEQGFLTAAQLEELQQAAYDEAFERGYADGEQKARGEIDARGVRFDALLTQLAEPFAELDECVEQQLVQLAMLTVRTLFRRELHSDPGNVIGVVRDAIQLLPVASRNVRVHLHPSDATLVRNALPETDGERVWSIVEDPLIQCGGCRITTDNSQIDAQVEARLASVISAIVGDERQ